MNACPDCQGLLIGDFDDENFSATQEPVGYYCPGCGWSSEDDGYPDHPAEDDDDFQPCAGCDGHDACADFGCAYQLGLGRLVRPG